MPSASAEDAHVGHVMLQIARREHLGLGDGERAVAQHAPALAIDEADRKAAIGILAAGDAVERVLGEEGRPIRDAVLVERRAIFGVELLDLDAQRARRRGIELGLGEAREHHSPMTSRQWR